MNLWYWQLSFHGRRNMGEHTNYLLTGFVYFALLSGSQRVVEGNGGCFFNACTLTTQQYCYNEGKCMFNETTCKNYCECAEGFIGIRCETPEADGSPTEQAPGDTGQLPPVEDRTCSATFVCFHGICDVDSVFFECICEYDWTGIFCDINMRQTTQNPLFQTEDSHSVTHVTSTPMVTPESDSRYNVCSDNPLQRQLTNRTCTSNLVCEHGVCQKTLVQHDGWQGWEYACICDPGAVGVLCEHPCCLDCGETGRCQINNGTEYCQCDRQYTGEECGVFVPDPVNVQVLEATWYLWIVGACAGILVILVTMSVIGPYLMWKHRVILVMKIFHYFQAYEDDDDKQWDAFVSYKSDPVDEDFVVQYLYPKLEQEMGFKLCLHFRDFVPGETISNNIINAVEGSRRTIMVLTPRYIESEFTRFEYQKAQHEMLKQKHRIIPVVLEDISSIKSNMDKNLQGIIDSVTYLEWPGNENTKKIDKFWKRLQLSLPKLKDTSTSVTSPLSTLSVDSNSPNTLSNLESSSCSSLPVLPSSSHALSISDNYCSSETIYTEISAIDDSSVHSEIFDIKPLSEKEELELMGGSDPINGKTNGEVNSKCPTDILLNDDIEEVFSNIINFNAYNSPIDSSHINCIIEKEDSSIITHEDVIVEFCENSDNLNVSSADANDDKCALDDVSHGLENTISNCKTNSLTKHVTHDNVLIGHQYDTHVGHGKDTVLNAKVDPVRIQDYIDLLDNATTV